METSDVNGLALAGLVLGLVLGFLFGVLGLILAVVLAAVVAYVVQKDVLAPSLLTLIGGLLGMGLSLTFILFL